LLVHLLDQQRSGTEMVSISRKKSKTIY